VAGILGGDDVLLRVHSGQVDAALLRNILHMEGPERCRLLLGKVHEALAPGGTIAVVEYSPDDDRSGERIHLIFAVNHCL